MDEGESNDRCFYKRQKRGDRDTEEKPREDRGTDRRDAATGPGMPGALEAGRGRKGPPLEPLEGARPSPAWISVVLPLLDLSGPSVPGSLWPCLAWMSVALPCLGLSGHGPPGSQWPCPSWVSGALPCLGLSGTAPPGSQWPCPAWISAALPCLDLSGPSPPGSPWSCPSWISASRTCLNLSSPLPSPASQWSCLGLRLQSPELGVNRSLWFNPQFGVFGYSRPRRLIDHPPAMDQRPGS